MTNRYAGCKNCNKKIIMRSGSHHWKHVSYSPYCKKAEPGGKCDDKFCICNICYECRNYNHQDCVSRKPKSKKKCSCWCTRKDSKYYNIKLPGKTIRGNRYG